jgi:hypothetical protein
MTVDIATGEIDDREPTPEERGKDPAAVSLDSHGTEPGWSMGNVWHHPLHVHLDRGRTTTVEIEFQNATSEAQAVQQCANALFALGNAMMRTYPDAEPSAWMRI